MHSKIMKNEFYSVIKTTLFSRENSKKIKNCMIFKNWVINEAFVLLYALLPFCVFVLHLNLLIFFVPSKFINHNFFIEMSYKYHNLKIMIIILKFLYLARLKKLQVLQLFHFLSWNSIFIPLSSASIPQPY